MIDVIHLFCLGHVRSLPCTKAQREVQPFKQNHQNHHTVQPSQAITSYHKSLAAPVGSTKAQKMHSATHLQFRVVDSRAWIQVLVYRPILAVVRHKESQVHDLRHRQRPQRDHRAGISGSDTLWLAHVLCCGHAQVWQISGDEIIRGKKNMVSLGIESLIHSMCMSKFLQNSYGRMEPTTAHNSTFPDLEEPKCGETHSYYRTVVLPTELS